MQNLGVMGVIGRRGRLVRGGVVDGHSLVENEKKHFHKRLTMCIRPTHDK